MSWQLSAIMLGGGVVLLMAMGTPVVIAFLAVNLLGAAIFMGGLAGIDQLIANATASITSFALVPVPLFILMGELLFHTGMAIRVFDALDKFLGAIRARLAYLTVMGGTIFATLSGSSIANTAMLGATLMPDMERRGYKKRLIMGPIIATGGIAMIIPPSSLAVLLGSLAKIDVGALLLAGIVPGVLLALMYLVVIRLHVWLDPEAAPPPSLIQFPAREKLRALVFDVLPMGLVIFAVVGLIILGIASPTESAAFGVLAILILAICYRKLSWQAIQKALWGTLAISVMMLIIILASSTFSQLLAFSGASAGLIGWMAGFELGPHGTLLAILAVLILLGMFMDQLSIMMLTLPIFMPLIGMQGIDHIQFGIIMLLALELSLATPPFGLLLFVMMGVAPKGTTIWEIVLSCLPYLACTLILILVLIWAPGLILW